MEDLVIHKLAITDEARFDYEYCLDDENYLLDWNTDTDWALPTEYDNPLALFPTKEIRDELEYWLQTNPRLHRREYFYTQHYDDHHGWLVFFIKRGTQLAAMQFWNLVGIAKSWHARENFEYFEDMGIHRGWYSSQITDLEKQEDWVEKLRQQLGEDTRELEKDIKERMQYERLFDLLIK